MDYDGANQHELTHLRTIALTPRWSPDATRIAFTCFAPIRGIRLAQICMYSTASDRLIAFPRLPGHEQRAGLVAGWIEAYVHVQPTGDPGNVRDRRGRLAHAPLDA